MDVDGQIRRPAEALNDRDLTKGLQDEIIERTEQKGF
jgi:hypothetical protein